MSTDVASGAPDAGSPQPAISVVVCTRDRAHRLSACLDHLREARSACSHASEIVVVDNASRDATPDVVRARADGLSLRYLFEPRPGLSTARNRGIDTLLVHALSENSAMLHIARKAGARIERQGAESRAVVKLARETLASRVEEIVEEQAASLAYAIKRQGQRVDHLLDALSKS